MYFICVISIFDTYLGLLICGSVLLLYNNFLISLDIMSGGYCMFSLPKIHEKTKLSA